MLPSTEGRPPRGATGLIARAVDNCFRLKGNILICHSGQGRRQSRDRYYPGKRAEQVKSRKRSTPSRTLASESADPQTEQLSDRCTFRSRVKNFLRSLVNRNLSSVPLGFIANVTRCAQRDENSAGHSKKTECIQLLSLPGPSAGGFVLLL